MKRIIKVHIDFCIQKLEKKKKSLNKMFNWK